MESPGRASPGLAPGASSPSSPKSPPKSPSSPKSSQSPSQKPDALTAPGVGFVPSVPPTLPPEHGPPSPNAVAAATAALPKEGGIQSKKPIAPKNPLSGMDGEFKGLFVSEWLTAHPLNLTYPALIWLHADCPPLVTPEEERAAGASSSSAATLRKQPSASASAAAASSLPLDARREIEYFNRAGIVHLQDGRLDDALSCFKEMEKAVRDHAPRGSIERSALLAVAHNNTAGYYYHKKGFPQVALQYAQKAASLERRVHGQTDFATQQRIACCLAKTKANKEAVSYCVSAIDTLMAAGSAAALANAKEQAAAAEAIEAEHAKTRRANSLMSQAVAATGGATGPNGPGLPKSVDGAYHAYLGVSYHNLAVCYAQCGQLQQANAMVNVADQLAAQSLPAKHRWSRQICATLHRLRDLHVSTEFVHHSLRPRLAINQARRAAAASHAQMLRSTTGSTSRLLSTTSLPPAGSGPPRRQGMNTSGSMGASASLPRL